MPAPELRSEKGASLAPEPKGPRDDKRSGRHYLCEATPAVASEIEPIEMSALLEAEPAGGGVLAQNIIHFARALREAGVPLGPGAVIDALAAVEAAGVGDREDFYATLHAVFIKKHEHSLLFDQAFRIFWKRKGFIEKLIAMLSPRAPSQPELEAPGSRREPRRRRALQVGPRPRETAAGD